MKDKKEMLLAYIKTNVAPLLIDFMSFNEMDIAVVLPATIDVKNLNGHYEGENFMLPKRLDEIAV